MSKRERETVTTVTKTVGKKQPKKVKTSVKGGSKPMKIDAPTTFRQPMRGFVGVRGDAKFVDVAAATYACNTTGSVTLLNTIPQGDTVSSRDGKSCRVTSVQIRGRWTVDTATTIASQQTCLVWDYDPKKTLAGLTDVLTSATAYAFPNRENCERFKIIRKWFSSQCGASGAPTTGKEVMDIDEYVRLPPDCNSLYTLTDTTGVIGNLIQGALLLVTVGDQAAGTTDMNLTAACRVNFTDINT